MVQIKWQFGQKLTTIKIVMHNIFYDTMKHKRNKITTMKTLRLVQRIVTSIRLAVYIALLHLA